MFTKKDRKIANQKAQIKNRDILIDDLKIENKILIQANKEGNKAIITLEKIHKLTNENKCDNEKVSFNEIKELVADYQSNN